MRTPEQLPDALAASGFRVSAALDAGLSRARLRRRDLQRPYYGARSSGADLSDHFALCTAAVPVIPPDAHISHRSAAVLHRMPLPWRAQPSLVEITVFFPTRAPELRGIRAHQLRSAGQRTTYVSGLSAIGVDDTWAQLGTSLSADDLVVVGDYLVTGDEPYSGMPPPTTLAGLESAVLRHGRRPGVQALRRAIGRIRYGSLSPQETRLRLALLDANLPEPHPNFRIFDTDGRVLAMIDLAYPHERVAIEYLGDHHRADPRAYRRDIARRELLVDSGWSVVFVTAADSFAVVARRVERLLLRSLPG